MSASTFRTAYDLSFQVSPIILKGGSVSGTLGGMVPISFLLTSLVGLAQGVLSGGGIAEDFPWRFLPIPGGTIINNAIATYPFANQQVAANAIIEQPKEIALLMESPVNKTAGYITKLPLMTALQTALANHIEAGGTFHVATPAYIYTDCLLTSMTDVTPGDTNQHQVSWQLNFVKPLVTTAAANAAYSGLMQKITNGSKITSSSWSGAGAGVGSAIQGATSDITNLAGSVNKFLSAPI